MNGKGSKAGGWPPSKEAPFPASKRAFARRGAAIFVSIVSAAACAAGSGCAGDGSEAEPGLLRVAIEAAPGSLDPRYAVDANASRIAGLLHCALVEPEPDGSWRPSLAARWTAESERSWLFELRPDARFHDGRAVTAADVVASFRSVLDPALASPKRAALATIDSVEEAGALGVRFRLSSADAAFFDAVSLGVLPADQAALARAAASSPTGCGPYRLESFDDARVRLEAVASWFGGDVTLPAIELRVVPDTVMRTLQLRSGDLDFVQNALEPDAASLLAATDASLRVTTTAYDAFQYLGINHRHPLLADLRVRRAIAHAIDREAIVRHLLAGQGEVASGLLPPHRSGYEARVHRYDFDPARARALLDEAGLRDPDGEDGPLPRLRLRYLTSTVELRRRIAEVVAAQLAGVGIEITIESYEWGTFFDDIARGDFELFSLAWVGIRDPDLFRLVFHSKMTPPAGSNRGFFANARMDRLTERGRRETDAARRAAIYARVQKLSARLLPYVPLWWPKNVVVTTTRLSGFTPHPAGDLAGLARATLAAP